MDFTWKDRVNGVDDVDSEDINSVGRAVEALSKEQILEITLDNKVLTKNAKKINIPLATDSENGAMSAQDKKKLDDLDPSKFKGNIESISANGTPLEPDENKNVDIPLSNSEQDGLISAEDKAKLDKIDDGAQVNVQSDWNQTDDTKDDYIKNKPNNLATETYVDEKLASQIGQKVDKEEGKGLSSNDFTDDYQSKVDTAVQSISANGTQLTPDENKNVDIPMVNGYNPGLVRISGSAWGIKATRMFIGEGTSHYYDGCLTTDPATQDDIDKRINSHKPITPATLKYAVESITNPVTLGTNEVIEDNSITINLLNNKKYILTQDTTYPNMTIEYTFDSSDPSIALNGFYEFNAGLIFKTPSDIDCNFIYPSSFYFIGDNAEDGEFAPQKNMVYEIMFSVEAKTGEKPYYIARVSGYEAPTNEVV